MNHSLSLILLVILVFALIAWQMYRDRSRSDRYCRLFHLDPKDYRLLGTDLGGGRDRFRLALDGLQGIPDAVFIHRRKKEYVVGEAKKRRNKEGRVSKYEFYQVTLYIGMLGGMRRHPVVGRLRYGCGKVVPVAFDDQTYRSLKALIPEYRRVTRRFSRFRGTKPDRHRVTI